MGKYNKQISPERKSLYYWGMALTGIGLLMFLSTFVTFMANFGNFDHFESRARSEGFRSFGGMILMMIGGFMMNVAKKGLAGSGILLDPEKARTDVEPWSRLQGGVVQDALADTHRQLPARLPSLPAKQQTRRLTSEPQLRLYPASLGRVAVSLARGTDA